MAQKDDATLLTQAGVIKAETTANANTATRVGTMMEDIIDSKMNNDDLIDEDDMSTNSATRPPSQQSVKAYVDAEVAGASGAVDSVNGQTGVVVVADLLLTFRTETASHTLDSTDLASINAGAALKVKMNVATANSVTIPLNATQAFPLGTQILVQWYGAGQTSIAATGGVTINSANGWVKLAYRYSSVVLTKVGTNEWDVEGSLTA